jgi:hypothetical protein
MEVLTRLKTSEILMTLDDMLRTGIAELPADTDRATYNLQHGAWTVRLSLERHDVLGCLLSDLRMHRQEPVSGSAKDWAGRLAQRVTGLLEPLKLYESDTARQLTTLRSEEPTTRAGAQHYYEVELHGLTELQLRRFQGFLQAGKKREQIPFALTYEGLAKLISDLGAD